MNGLETHPEAFQYLVQGSCALGVSLFLTSYALVRCVPSGRMVPVLLCTSFLRNLASHAHGTQGPGQGPYAAGPKQRAGLPVDLQAHSLRLPGKTVCCGDF